jgi:hypothetical protein
MSMREVPQAASLKSDPMIRQVLIVIGAVLLSIGGIGLIVGLVWLVASNVLGTLPYILESRFETLLYILPALLLVVAIIGASFMATAVATRQKDSETDRRLHLHTRFHA